MPASRLALFAPNLSGGGAERTLARLATHWSEQGRDVTLVTLAAASPSDFPTPPAVRRVGLGLTADSRGPLAAARNNLRRVRATREAFRAARPDAVVSFLEQANVLALLAARPLGLPVVAAERTDPARHPVPRLWSFLRGRTYPRCAALVVLTDEAAALMRPVARGRPVIVIPNGVPAPAPPAAGDPDRERTVLGVGRLGPEKGFDRLVVAFAAASGETDGPPWRLAIVGDGPQRGELETFARSCRGAAIELPGRVADPDAWYRRAALFAFTSRYEGFPNALLEAMAHGLPAVAFDGPAAVRQVVRHGRDGLLVPDGNLAEFAAALRGLMTDEPRRRRMGEAAREVAVRFGLAPFFARWDAAVDAAATGDFSQVTAAGGE